MIAPDRKKRRASRAARRSTPRSGRNLQSRLQRPHRSFPPPCRMTWLHSYRQPIRSQRRCQLVWQLRRGSADFLLPTPRPYLVRPETLLARSTQAVSQNRIPEHKSANSMKKSAARGRSRRTEARPPSSDRSYRPRRDEREHSIAGRLKSLPFLPTPRTYVPRWWLVPPRVDTGNSGEPHGQLHGSWYRASSPAPPQGLTARAARA